MMEYDITQAGGDNDGRLLYVTHTVDCCIYSLYMLARADFAGVPET